MAARMRKRPDGRYCVSVSDEDGGAGIAPRHYVYGRAQAEANAKAKAARERFNAGAPVRDASRTLSGPSVVRTNAVRRRCGSIPTNCPPAYSDINVQLNGVAHTRASVFP
jgi:hypothetical protein